LVKAPDFEFVSVLIKHLQEIIYSESCGHVTDDFMYEGHATCQACNRDLRLNNSTTTIHAAMGQIPRDLSC